MTDLELMQGYDDAYKIVDTITMNAAGTGIWDKLDRVRHYIKKQATKHAEIYLFPDAEEETPKTAVIQ